MAVDADNNAVPVHKMFRQRPMTGAASIGAKRSNSKGRRYGPYPLNNPSFNLGSHASNQKMSHNHTLQTLDRGRMFSGKINNRSIENFSMGQKNRQSQGGFVGDAKTLSNARAKSSNQNRQLGTRNNAIMSTSQSNYSRQMGLVSATALSQIPPKTNL